VPPFPGQRPRTIRSSPHPRGMVAVRVSPGATPRAGTPADPPTHPKPSEPGFPGCPPLIFAPESRNSLRPRPRENRLHCENCWSVIPGYKVPSPARGRQPEWECAPPIRPPAHTLTSSTPPIVFAQTGDRPCGRVVLTVSGDHAGHACCAPRRGRLPFAAGRTLSRRVARGREDLLSSGQFDRSWSRKQGPVYPTGETVHRRVRHLS